ncbi:DUF4129 domain-containing protein [Streptomyces sp. NPDC089919]|uniref:DUF4129 domain-containing protein n=1 Tax=Streptomyces sp. NPDC089919 TaxID=3155188 RepID=UPI0034143A18
MSTPGGVTAPPARPAAARRAARCAAALPVAPLAAGPDEPPVVLPRGPAQEEARRELARSVYHQHDPSLLQRALNRFWEWVGDLFDTASGATPGGVPGLIAVVLFALLLAAGLWWRLGTPHRTATPAGTLFGDRPRTAAEHRRTAGAHAAAGRWTEAVQERMRALVRDLEERALLDPRPGRTADEAAAEAARVLPGHAAPLRAAARTFDELTYGGRPGDEAAYARLSALDEALRATRPQLAAAQETAP